MKLLAYDISQRKVGCVLLQVVMGGDPNLAKRIPNEYWLTSPTPGLTVYRLTEDEAEQLVRYHGGL
jgi:hypothetical protein